MTTADIIHYRAARDFAVVAGDSRVPAHGVVLQAAQAAFLNRA